MSATIDIERFRIVFTRFPLAPLRKAPARADR